MRFLSDQDVYAVTVRFLRDLGHDVVTAAEFSLSRMQSNMGLASGKTVLPWQIEVVLAINPEHVIFEPST